MKSQITSLLAISLFILNDFIEAFSDPNKFLIKFAMNKARENCVGEKLTRVWENQVRNIVQECQYDGVHNYNDDRYDDYRSSILAPSPDPYGAKGLPLPPIGFIPDHALSLGNTGVGFNNALIHGISAIGYRQKRSLEGLDTASEGKNFIRSLIIGEKKIREKIANVTCILRNLNVIDDAGNLLISAMIDSTAQMPIDPLLKDDLIVGLDQCSRYVSCLPPPTRPSPLITFEVKRAFAFVRCSQLKRQQACIKKDIRSNIESNFPRDLKGTLDLESFTQRMLDVLMAEDIEEYEALLL